METKLFNPENLEEVIEANQNVLIRFKQKKKNKKITVLASKAEETMQFLNDANQSPRWEIFSE